MRLKTSWQKIQVATPSETTFSHIVTGNYSMHSGKYSLMTNSLKHITMGSFASAIMAYIVDFIPAYLPIQLTIQKSGLLLSQSLFGSWSGWLRVLIATICNMGECLCPCCLIPKSRVHQIATATDILHWKVFTCCDTKEWCDKVATAHQLIYEKHYAVHTPQVKELLKDESLVPTLVECSFARLYSKSDNYNSW